MANPSSGGDSVSQATRFAHLETQVGNVAVQLGDFIKDSKEYRERTERDQAQIWAAIKDQGEQFRGAVEKLSGRGQISWQMIVATVGMVLSVSAAAAGVGHALMQSQIRQLEIREEYLQKAVDECHTAIREIEKCQKKN
jgi:hypothetical protein